MNWIIGHKRLIVGALLIVTSIFWFTAAHRQTHNTDYKALQVQQAYLSSYADQFYDLEREGGMAGVFAKANGDMVKENADSLRMEMRVYEKKSRNNMIAGGISLTVGIALTVWQIVGSKRKQSVQDI